MPLSVLVCDPAAEMAGSTGAVGVYTAALQAACYDLDLLAGAGKWTPGPGTSPSLDAVIVACVVGPFRVTAAHGDLVPRVRGCGTAAGRWEDSSAPEGLR